MFKIIENGSLSLIQSHNVLLMVCIIIKIPLMYTRSMYSTQVPEVRILLVSLLVTTALTLIILKVGDWTLKIHHIFKVIWNHGRTSRSHVINVIKIERLHYR